jgi:potassium/hydrogen antiporter
VPPHSPIIGQSLMQLALPRDVLVVLVRRERESLVPNGATIFEANDRLLLLASPAIIPQVQAQITPPSAPV